MKHFIIFLFVGFSFCSQAQWSVFIEPTISTKASISSTSPVFASSFIPSHGDFFSYRNRFLVYPQKLSPILLGLNIGTVSKNKRNIFKFGFNSDESNSGFSFAFHSYGGNTGGSYNDGRSFTNLHLNYSYRLNQEPKQFDFYFDLGIGVGYRKQHAFGPWSDYGSAFTFPDGQSYDLKAEVTTPFNRTFLVSSGFSMDIKSAKGAYLFTTSLFYTHSMKLMSNIIVNITMSGPKYNDKDNLNFFSRGSGIYFQVSRRLQLFPWLIKKKSKKTDAQPVGSAF